MAKNKKIESLIEEGQKILDSSKFEDYEKWKRSVQFFIEKHGTPMMIKEIEKEVNRRPLWIAYSGQPPGELEDQFRTHKIETIKKINSLLAAINSISLENPSKKRDKKRNFSQSIKNLVWAKQEGKCLRCKEQLSPISTHYDHIKAWEDGGESNETNCQALCANCHSIKTNEDRLKKHQEN